jgi:hypothetical protein
MNVKTEIHLQKKTSGSGKTGFEILGVLFARKAY